MKKRRKYLKDLIPVNINELVLATGYYELQIGDKLLSLAPDRCPDGSYVISLFVNHLRQPKVWELSARPHVGRLQRGGHIPYRNDEVYYVVSGGRRYRHLFIDSENMMIGTRSDFFRDHNRAYPRGRARKENMSFKEQCRSMERELFPAERDELARWNEDYRRMEKNEEEREEKALNSSVVFYDVKQRIQRLAKSNRTTLSSSFFGAAGRYCFNASRISRPSISSPIHVHPCRRFRANNSTYGSG
jgi:hypothetical protein